MKIEDWVFLSFNNDGKIVPMADIKGSFGRVLEDAGITNFRFHDLRHTFASHYMMNGGQQYALSSILGHKDLKMMQRYAKLSPEYMDSQRDRMDTMGTPAPIPSPDAASQTPSKYVQ